jgi:hypothetical protein
MCPLAAITSASALMLALKRHGQEILANARDAGSNHNFQYFD